MSKKSFNEVFKFNTLEGALNKINELLNNPLEKYRLKSRILTKDRQMRIDEFIYL